MNQVTYLKQSIKKYKAIIEIIKAGGDWIVNADKLLDECPLCTYHHSGNREGCNSCLVFLDTGKTHCKDTPYYSLNRALNEKNREDAQSESQKMLQFLTRLIP